MRFHCPCKTLCALVTLDQRHLINDQIYLPARAVFLADSSLPALLFPGAPQMWGRGQVAGRKGALAATSLFLATVFLAGPSASSESLVLSSQLVTVALKEGCDPQNREVHPLQAGGVCVLGDRWHPGLAPLSATLQTSEAQPGKECRPGLHRHRAFGTSSLG